MVYKIDVNKITAKLKKKTEAMQPILNNQVVKDSNVYCPKAEGTLQSSALKSDMTKPYVKWIALYAKKMYYGVNLKFSKDANPNARAKWFEEAKAKKKKEWLKIMNAKVKQ